jgi:iron complex transport system substrate-binding protein
MRRIPTLIVLLAAVSLAACGSDDERPSAAGEGTTRTEPAAVFPVTVEHRFGSTTVPTAAERIAVVGLTEQDAVLALGQVPIATTEWYGDQPSAVCPGRRTAWAARSRRSSTPPTASSSSASPS